MAEDDSGALSLLANMPDAEPSPGGGPAPDADAGARAALANMPSADDVNSSPPPKTPPPARKLGPPRLHMQQHQPRSPPPAGPAPAAAQQPPAPTWEEVPGLFAKNILPSTGHVIGDTLEALKPTNWGRDVSSLNQLGVGALSKAGVYGGSAAEKKKDQAVLDAVLAAKKQQWWGKNGEGLRRSLAYTPAEDFMDVATVAGGVGGLAGLAARAPALAGEAAEAAGNIARTARFVEAATNPIGYPLRAAGLAARAPGAAIRAARRATGAGRAADAAEAMMRTVHPTEPIPNEMLTGVGAGPDHTVAVGQSRAAWRKIAGEQATGITGADAPDTAALGSALEKRQIAAHNTAIDNYDEVGTHPGQFAPAFAPTLRGAVDTAFKDATLPPVTGPGAMSTLPGTYGKTLDAMNAMHTQVDDLAAANALTPSNLMRVRQEIGAAYRGATGSDVKGLRTLQEALDNHIADMAQAGAYGGGDGAAVANSMGKAIDGWRTYQKIFNDGPAAKAVGLLRKNQVTDATGRLTPAAAGTTEQVTQQLGKDLINPNLSTPGGAQLLYNHLHEKILGADGADPLHNFIRQSVTRATDQGTLAAKAGQIQGFLKTPLGRSVFTPDEQTKLGNLSEVDRMALQKPMPGTRGAGLVKNLVVKGGRHLAGMAAAMKLGPLGPAAAEGFMSHVVDPYFAARSAAKAFRTAGGPKPWLARAAMRVGTGAYQGWEATPQSPAEQQQEAEQNEAEQNDQAPPVVKDVATRADMGKSPAATPTDIDAVVRMAAAEGDPTPEGWQAVAAVMRNRSLLGGLSLSDVAAEPGRRGSHQFEAYGNHNYTGLQPGSARYQQILAAIAPVLAGKVDPTNGADSYYAPKLQADEHRNKPDFDDGEGVPIGTQLFFKGKYRQQRAAGGQVHDLVGHLMNRAERAQKASQASTKPLLGLSDDTVAKALAIAGRAI